MTGGLLQEYFKALFMKYWYEEGAGDYPGDTSEDSPLVPLIPLLPSLLSSNSLIVAPLPTPPPLP